MVKIVFNLIFVAAAQNAHLPLYGSGTVGEVPKAAKVRGGRWEGDATENVMTICGMSRQSPTVEERNTDTLTLFI